MRWGLLAFLALSATTPLTIHLSSNVIMRGNAVRLTCRVYPDARNRWLEYGLSEYAPGSVRQLDGEQAPITWQTTIPHVPCDPGVAYCAVYRADGQVLSAKASLTVAGCDEP